MTESFAVNTENHFRSPLKKLGRRIKVVAREYSRTYKTKWVIKGKTGDSIYKIL